VAALIPLGHVVVTGLGLVYFVRTRRSAAFRRSQFCLILALPALLQWSLGGFAGSGGVVLWALFAPLGALLFEGTRRSVPWFVAFVTVVLLAGLLDPWLLRLPARRLFLRERALVRCATNALHGAAAVACCLPRCVVGRNRTDTVAAEEWRQLLAEHERLAVDLARLKARPQPPRTQLALFRQRLVDHRRRLVAWHARHTSAVMG
jgi:hypothetical protein